MQLRQYQIDLIKKIFNAWSHGAQNVLMQLPTGGGKTCLFCHIILQRNEPTVIIAHRIELVAQISLTLARYGIKHNIISNKQTIRSIISTHVIELKHSFFDEKSQVIVIGVDTLIKLDSNTAWFKQIKLVIQDEAHHVLKSNKWGKAANLFTPWSRGLYPTATPMRADGYGLGRHADGVIDEMVTGLNMRDLINQGYLTDYRIFAPPSDLDLSDVSLSASGDYSPPKLRTAVHKSHITGDVVAHYLKIAPGKLGVTFAVDIEAAEEIANEFKLQGVSCEIISSKTPDLLRVYTMRRFQNREILQLVNVDLLGEGVDVPAIEVVSFARPTQSYGLYVQQFGRALRPMTGKTHAIIIDHVGNVLRHGLPDSPRNWSLDRRERKGQKKEENPIPLRTCLNLRCMRVYERIHKICPYCNHSVVITSRNKPEEVDGDLEELSLETLAQLRGEINRIDNTPHPPKNLEPHVQRAIMHRHEERQQAQQELRKKIAEWAGYYRMKNYLDSAIHRQFFFNFDIDVLTAQTLNTQEANILIEKIQKHIADFDKII